MTAPLVVVGDTLLDRDLAGTVDRVCPDAPVPVVDDPQQTSRPGGAGLAAVLAARDGRAVTLVTALCDDASGQELRALLTAEGVEVVDLGADGTTVEKVRVRAEGRSLLRLDRGSCSVTGDLSSLPEGTVLVADYGRGVTSLPGVRAALAGRRVVWDPHPRGAQPVPGCVLVTPNAAEAAAPGSLAGVTARARELRTAWQAQSVVVTLGSQGALLLQGDALPAVLPAPVVPCSDPCGAGDRFASAAAGLLADGALVSEAVAGAVAAAAAFVGAGGAAALPAIPGGAPPAWSGSSVEHRVAAVRATGGTVVATGGCFDLLHAGHVSVLEQARRLGDLLVVLLNSDDSVRRLKGPTRPLQHQLDRARVLQALGCVDEVVVFDEDTPIAALERLQPDVWVKGGDYADLPEAPVVEGWGGQAVVLPYLAGRSTTHLIREASLRA